MRRVFFAAALALSSLAAFSLSALVYDSYDRDRFGWNVTEDISFSAGYRMDNLHWSIAGNSRHPNILSELVWQDLCIWEFKTEARWLMCRQLYIKASADYGQIFHGRNTDTDYDGDDKTLPYSKSMAISNQGEVFDFSGGIGWMFHMNKDQWVFGPVVGYTYNVQHLRDHKGHQVLSEDNSLYGGETYGVPVGSIHGLHSNYRARWQGPWLGIDTNYTICDDWEVYGTAQYHWIWFHGSGHWNLRTDFIRDFQQHAKGGHGYSGTIGSRYNFWKWWWVSATGSYTWLNSGSGVDKTFFSAGTARSHFNGCTWHSWSVYFDLGRNF